MGAIAHFNCELDNPNVPMVGWSSIARPLSSVLWHWGSKLRYSGMDEYEREDKVSWRCLERAHHELPYTFEGFKAWMVKTGFEFKGYNVTYFAEWDQYHFDKFRDFIRYGALHREKATIG